MKDSPCKDCNKRYAGCHSNCRDYKVWKALKDKIRAKIAKENELAGYFAGK